MFMFAGMNIKSLFERATADMEKSDFSQLDLLHHVSSGFKAYCTDYAYASMDQLRQACGGAGFLMASGLPFNFVNNAPLVTYEGVNVIMY